MVDASRSASLAERLKELRARVPGGAVTQRHVADALGLSVPLVSSWESGKAVPPEDRLRAYALVFAAPERAFGSDPAQLPDESELSAQQEVLRRKLIDDLFALRERITRTDDPVSAKGALGGTFWYLPGDVPIRIITSPMWPKMLKDVPYANRWHPNFIESLLDADRDATIELFGHIRAENPTADVRFLTADRVTRDDLTGHVVILGQADGLLAEEPVSNALAYMLARMELPVRTRVRKDGDPEYDAEFLVTTDGEGKPCYFSTGETPTKEERFRPVFYRDENASDGRRRIEGEPLLDYDVALIARKSNELNLQATVTVCSGVFSRGTYGAVRAFTDSALRARNEQYLSEHLNPDDFWLLTYVPAFLTDNGLETVTPDLGRHFHRLRSSV